MSTKLIITLATYRTEYGMRNLCFSDLAAIIPHTAKGIPNMKTKAANISRQKNIISIKDIQSIHREVHTTLRLSRCHWICLGSVGWIISPVGAIRG